MNWRNMAIEELRNYDGMKSASVNLRDRLDALTARMTSVRTSSLSATPSHGGGSQYEDKLLDTITEIDALREEIRHTDRMIALIERGLSALSATDRTVLEKFYIHRTSRYIDELCELLNCEQAEVYRTKDSALHGYTLAVYGAGNMTAK